MISVGELEMLKLELLGKRFGRLVVTSEYLKSNGRHKWLCSCACGNEITVQGSHLNKGLIRSCGCLRRETTALNGRNNSKQNKVAALHKLYYRYKHAAKKKNRLFELDLDFFAYLVNQPCHYCKIHPNQLMHAGNDTIVYTGIDRVDCNVGYIESNVVPCCGVCNRAKYTQTSFEFENWIERAYNTLQQRRKSNDVCTD